MTVEGLKRVTLEAEPGFPAPIEDRLGLARDPIYLSSRKTPHGQEFVLVHSRPILGEGMFVFLNEVAAYPVYRGVPERGHFNDTFLRPDPQRDQKKSNQRESFDDRLRRIHRTVDHRGIARPFSQFVAKAAKGWTETTEDRTLDSVYVPLKMMLAFPDFTPKAKYVRNSWLGRFEGEPLFLGPGSGLFDILKLHNPDYVASLQQKLKDGIFSQEEIKRKLLEYLGGLSAQDNENLVGNVLSKYGMNERIGALSREDNEDLEGYRDGNCLIVDVAGERYWYRIRGGTENPDFKAPKINFTGNNSLSISDPENTASVHVALEEGNSKTKPMPWRITSHHLPESSARNARYAAIAWKVDGEGKKEFLNYTQTITAVAEAGIPITGTPDSYIGKALLRYFRRPGEYVPSYDEDKWQTEMGLPGTHETLDILVTELPVWLDLPQHHQDLLHSNFLTAAERLAD